MSKKYTYIWIGQNATTGDPHPLTGYMSRYGHLYKVLKKEASEMLDILERKHYPNAQITKIGGKRTMRQFHRGISVSQFETELEYLPVEQLENWKGESK